MKNYALIDTRNKQARHIFQAESMSAARKKAAYDFFGWSDEEGPSAEHLFEGYAADVIEWSGPLKPVVKEPPPATKSEKKEKKETGMIIGIDEVGRGNWAGPLVVCAFAAPSEEWTVDGINDSKKLTDKKMREVNKKILADFPDKHVVIAVEPADIDKHGIDKVNKMAMERAMNLLIKKVGMPDRVIIDGPDVGILGAEFFTRADNLYTSVMAASIIAKVFLDDLMLERSKKYPGYGFDTNIGYGSAEHRKALEKQGICEIHRKSFQPMAGILNPRK